MPKPSAAASVVVFLVCAVLAVVGWLPLGLIPRILGEFIPAGTCTGLTPATPMMYACSMKVALFTVTAPLIVMAALFLARNQVSRWIARLMPRLAPEVRFLTAPVTATLFFTISWSGAHQATALQSGVLPQTVFPSVVGLFTFAVVRFGPRLQQLLVAFFDVRDRYPVKARFAAAIVIPLAFSLLITFESRVSQTALKEQLVVVLSLVTGYLAMAPRTGDLLSAVRDLVPQRAR